MQYNGLKMTRVNQSSMLRWNGPGSSIARKPEKIMANLLWLNKPIFVLQIDNEIAVSQEGQIIADSNEGYPCLGILPPFLPEQLGDPQFCKDHQVKYPYHAGAMANGITSEELVIELGKEGFLATFGAGGFTLKKIEQSIKNIQAQLTNGSFAVNLLHNPANPEWEWGCVDLFLKSGVTTVEASAFLNLTGSIVYYRAAGLSKNADGTIKSKTRVIAKVSRPEVARHFMKPAPKKILDELINKALITEEQAQLAAQVPVAEDITIEGDSGGHTDNGVLMNIFPSIMELKSTIEKQYNYQKPIRLGAAGGIGTPQGALAGFALGASYIVTGSVNQPCVEAGTSDYVKTLLLQAELADVMMTPASDMFEIGAKVQVLKRGTFYPVRAQKLYDLYKNYNSIEEIPQKEMAAIEKQYFKKPVQVVWEETIQFFQQRDPKQIEVAQKNSKRKMALIFQWYLGQSSNWAISEATDRKMDYQIWCGSSLGAFNDWVKGTHLEKKENRKVADIAHALMRGAAYLHRLQLIKGLGVFTDSYYQKYKPGIIGTEFIKPVSSNIYSTKGDSEMSTTKLTNSKRIKLEKSKKFFDSLWDYIPGGTHYNFAEKDKPLVVPFCKGRGSRVWDMDGNEHLDLFCKFGALLTGHYNQKYNKIIIDYMDKVTSVDICDLEGEVGELMQACIPCAEQIRFGLSGTESVQNAIRLARAYTGKSRFIRFQGHYHGNADNIMGGKLSEDLSYPVPNMYKDDYMDTLGRYPNTLQDQSFILPWNEIDILEKTVSAYSNELAAIIMEPICINGGGIMPRQGYLERVREICNQNNIMLIFDEIITGFRVGLGGAQGILGVTPDIATFGKALAGGSLPVSAITGRKEIMELYRIGKVIHAGTFNGYPLGLAAVKASVSLLMEDADCYDRMGKYMLQIANLLIKAANDIGLPMVVQGMPTALVYHSQSEPVEVSEGYKAEIKMSDVIIREVCKRYGIQFSPLSRIYSNLMLCEDDVKFFEDRIWDALKESKSIINVTITERR